MSILTLDRALVEKECGACGVLYAMPQSLENECLKFGPAKRFYCPNGHGRVYAEGEIGRLKADLASKDRLLADALNGRDAERRRADASEASRARLLRRVRAGVCPHCRRSFANLQRHVTHQHPHA